ncbi:microfibril-associated glycoprotein 4-like [Takifugu flavidus]|uniref:Microfibril-associated glycoprotein 4 36 kDa microfibril-associated glycoprotein n=1 Tax=Takifugu flavidus TaxID=433684 RepID=A0A5C6PT50_9TELE|nr:microfibril-associated glycoprotein 4-like [Takifugu flavidus]TWW82176.1 Microfibril-associated glycoprotein 4 36 kDa microfibril-associated glycoprotein [Takifugu flavidus]
MEGTMLRVVLAALLTAVARPSPLPTDCSDVYKAGWGQSGVYAIYPAGPTSPVQVYCDMSPDRIDTSPEKWTVIQRRQDGTVNFYMKWDHYKRGFGSAAGEYWLGLETMHLLTQAKKYELKVDMEDFDGQNVFAHYSSFSVGPEAEGYKLSLGSFVKGAAGDSLSGHNGMKFTTIDKDQDTHESNCAQLAYGAFWYYNCFGANPNGIYTWGPSPPAHGAQWRSFRGLEYSLKTIVMKIRPVAE